MFHNILLILEFILLILKFFKLVLQGCNILLNLFSLVIYEILYHLLLRLQIDSIDKTLVLNCFTLLKIILLLNYLFIILIENYIVLILNLRMLWTDSKDLKLLLDEIDYFLILNHNELIKSQN